VQDDTDGAAMGKILVVILVIVAILLLTRMMVARGRRL
jgi:hypothetical protein